MTNKLIFFVILQRYTIFNFLCVDDTHCLSTYSPKRVMLNMTLHFIFQRLPIVKVISHFLPNGAIQIRGSGFLTILTSGSVILASPERIYS